MTDRVQVRAPCRLHFGMFSFGHVDQPQFGGVGMMVAPPAVEATIEPATSYAATGSLVVRVDRFVATLVENWRLREPPACRIRVNSPPDHIGLGVGTQLGLAVATGLRRFLNMPEQTPEELANSVGRGARSAVGTHGFDRGGLIVDAGKRSAGPLGSLARRVEMPSAWRVILIRPSGVRGLAGDQEVTAFGRLPPVPALVTRELRRIVDEELLPAVEQVNCGAFGEAVYRFGRLAGECFAAVQGGPFASAEIERLIESIRGRGVPGVGQSSWGPTVFAITATEVEARELVDWLCREWDGAEPDLVIARPNNCGAQLSVC